MGGERSALEDTTQQVVRMVVFVVILFIFPCSVALKENKWKKSTAHSHLYHRSMRCQAMPVMYVHLDA